MSRFSFKGDIESVKPTHINFIGNVIEKRGFKAAEVHIEAMGKAGDNYMSIVKKIKVTENNNTLLLVAKLAPDNEMMREISSTTDLFNNENIIYGELLPKFKQLQLSSNVPEKDLLKFAECYGVSLEKPDEIILLENLNSKNYRILNRLKPLPNECIKSALRQLAIYHSLSYVLKHREPETFAALVSKITDIYDKPMPEQTENT